LKFLVPFALLIALGTNLWSTLAERNIPTEIAPAAISQALVQAPQPVPDAFSFAPAEPHATNWLFISILATWALGFLAIVMTRLRGWLRVRAALRSSRPFEIRHPEGCEAARRAVCVPDGSSGRTSLSSSRHATDLRQSTTFSTHDKEKTRHPEWCPRFSRATRRTPLAFFRSFNRNSAQSSFDRIRSTPGLLEPGVVGLFRPTLLLPEGILQNLTPPQLEAVLAHEFTHIGRCDNLTAALHMLVEAVFWFHPAVWWIGARLIEERERACDEAVLSLGNQPRDYAEAILNVCKLYVESPLVCVPGITGADLKQRIHAILAGHIASELNLTKQCGLAIVGLAALALPIVVGLLNTPSLRAQSEDRTSLSFEVASVKPDPDESHYFGHHIDIDVDGALYHATGVSAEYLIKYAYALSDDQLSGGPDWIDSDKYAIDAKIPETVVADWHKKYNRTEHDEQMREMIRSLLADRFQLKVGHETKELPVFALEVAKGGPKFVPANDDGSNSGNDGHNEGNVEIDKITNRPISTLVQMLQGQPEVQGRKIVDETGLTATYTYTLEWTRQRPLEAVQSSDTSAPDSSAPPLEDALETQLGLQLKSTKAPIDTIVIAHIEKPTPN
jgi:uncharacterized protein (TIGR03435 family)